MKIDVKIRKLEFRYDIACDSDCKFRDVYPAMERGTCLLFKEKLVMVDKDNWNACISCRKVCEKKK